MPCCGHDCFQFGWGDYRPRVKQITLKYLLEVVVQIRGNAYYVVTRNDPNFGSLHFSTVIHLSSKPEKQSCFQ